MNPDVTPTPVHILDAASLSATELSEKYASTYSSWRNMKQRRVKGFIIDAAFEAFRSFLSIVGPRPSDNHSIDRIDTSNPTYGPGLVRWLDKKGQANNRSTTIILRVDGVEKPLTSWAEETGQQPATLRSRRDKGWSDREIVHGRGNSSGQWYTDFHGKPWEWRPWENSDQRQWWETKYQQDGNHNEIPIDYFIRKTSGQAQSVLEQAELVDGDGPIELTPEQATLRGRYEHLTNLLEWARAQKSRIKAEEHLHKWPSNRGPRRTRRVDWD